MLQQPRQRTRGSWREVPNTAAPADAAASPSEARKDVARMACTLNATVINGRCHGFEIDSPRISHHIHTAQTTELYIAVR